MVVRRLYEFGGFRLDAEDCLLYQDNEAIPLPPKAVETLLALVEKSGHVATKDELLQRVWPDTFVEEGSLAQNIFLLRRTLGDDRNGNRIIATVPKRGYRFVWPVTVREETLPRSQVEAAQVAPQTAAVPALSRRIGWKLRTGLVLLIVGAAVAGYFGWPPFRTPSTGTRQPAVLAVLPFANGTPDPQAEYLSDGITETLINRLSQLPNLRVKARSTVFRYKGQQTNPQQIGRALGVETVLTGTVAQRADALVIQAELVRVADGAQLWGEQYSRPPADIFAVQEEIARKIAAALQLRLTGTQQQQLSKRYTQNPEAYHLYLRGRHLWQDWDPQTLEKSIQYFQQAIALDPNYALAYADLGNTWATLNYLTVLSAREVMPKAKEAVVKALALDNELAEAHLYLGDIRFFYDWDPSGAEREYKRAIELNANSAQIRRGYAIYLTGWKRFDESIAQMNLALELEPFSPYINWDAAQVLLYARQYDQAIERCQKAVELDPNASPAYLWLYRAYEQKGLHDQAIAAYLKLASSSGASADAVAAYREAYAVSGWEGLWAKNLERSLKQAKQGYVFPFWVAEAYARLGQKDQALVWLEKASQDRDGSWLTVLPIDPIWDGFRSDPRFVDLVRRIGLPP